MRGLHIIITIVGLFAFIGLCIWAYRPRNRDRFEKNSKIVFLEEDKEEDSKDE